MASDKTDEDYQSESDCRTLVEADKIMKNGSRYDAAMKIAKVHHEELTALAGQHAMSKDGGKDDDDEIGESAFGSGLGHG